MRQSLALWALSGIVSSINLSNLENVCNRKASELGSGCCVIRCVEDEIFDSAPNVVRCEPLWKQNHRHDKRCVGLPIRQMERNVPSNASRMLVGKSLSDGLLCRRNSDLNLVNALTGKLTKDRQYLLFDCAVHTSGAQMPNTD